MPFHPDAPIVLAPNDGPEAVDRFDLTPDQSRTASRDGCGR